MVPDCLGGTTDEDLVSCWLVSCFCQNRSRLAQWQQREANYIYVVIRRSYFQEIFLGPLKILFWTQK